MKEFCSIITGFFCVSAEIFIILLLQYISCYGPEWLVDGTLIPVSSNTILVSSFPLLLSGLMFTIFNIFMFSSVMYGIWGDKK